MDIYEKMKELGVELPAAPAKGGCIPPAKSLAETCSMFPAAAR